VDVEARMSDQPPVDRRRLVGAVVVEDYVDVELNQPLSANSSAVVVPKVRRSCVTDEPATTRAQADLAGPRRQFRARPRQAMHIRNIPGRKSDVSDATWIAYLLAHGLIRGSFVPPAPVQELRELTRTRKQLVREITQHTLRIQKTLENARA
jgi:hypothetical protein